MKKRWVMRAVESPELIPHLQRTLNNLPEPLARALALRGITTLDDARHFFRPSLGDLHDPFLMQDMDAAADRLVSAVRRRERVLVYGDYDVDGTTAVALMTRFLRTYGAAVEFFIPDRFRHGYGLNRVGLDEAVARGASLVLTLDCGITALEEAAYARALGLDLIICDHHTPGETLPDALAVLNPKRVDCAYPFKDLCGCGVGFKLVQAVLARLGEPADQAWTYLDLVAIATAADIVSASGENRVLLREGLERIHTAPQLGLQALANQAGLDLRTCDTHSLVFTIGPRINAAGRVGDAARAVELLLTEDLATAQQRALELEQANIQRRALDLDTQEQAIRMAERQLLIRDRRSIVLYKPDWHLGVIGIVASRIVERFHRPAVILCAINGKVKGSGRSIYGINLYEALKACSDLVVNFGGHMYAAGLTLEEDNLLEFQTRFDAAVEAATTPELMVPIIEVDAPLDLRALDARFWSVLKQFAPSGPDNDTPIFQTSNLQIVGQPANVGREGQHLKFSVRQEENQPAFEVIGFGMRQHLDTVQESHRRGLPLELLCSVQENHWNGTISLQLRARDLRLQQG